MAEHSAVNRRVVGSSPTCGANIFQSYKATMHGGLKFCAAVDDGVPGHTLHGAYTSRDLG